MTQRPDANNATTIPENLRAAADLARQLERLRSLPRMAATIRAITGMSQQAAERFVGLPGPTPTPAAGPLELPDEPPLILTDLQLAIMKALDGKAMGIEKLADQVSGGEPTVLYRDGGLKELRETGHVEHKRGVGFYRPDSPPLHRVVKKLVKKPS